MLSQALSETLSKLVRTDGRPVEWAVSTGYVPYDEAVAAMEARAEPAKMFTPNMVENQV